MKRGGTIVIALLAAVLAIAAYYAMRDTPPPQAAGQAFLPDLDKSAERVAVVEAIRGETTVRLERQADGSWVVTNADSFPAQTELVRALIVSVGSLRLHEAMTANPARYGELGLAWPDTSGRSRRVRLLPAQADQPAIADVILGDERAQPDTIYVRQFDKPETWSARGRVQLPSDALAWTDRSLLALARGETRSATLRGLTLTMPADAPPEGVPVPWPSSVAPGAAWTDRQIQSAQFTLPNFLERVEFEGVRKQRVQAEADPLYSPAFTTRDGSVQVKAHKETDGVWFTLDAVGASPTLARVAQRAKGWEFRMPTWVADSLDRLHAPDPPTATPAGAPPDGAVEAPNK